jgi:hypothetical protein
VEFKLTLPEGMQADAGRHDAFVALAKEKGLNPEQAQALVDFAAKQELERVAQHKQAVQGWAESVKTGKGADGKDLPEHLRVPGGEQLPETLSACKKAVDLAGPELGAELRELLDFTGMGSHPAVVKWTYEVGKRLSQENRIVTGEPAGEAAPERRFFGNTMGG